MTWLRHGNKPVHRFLVRIASLPNILIVIWFVVLYRHERSVFINAIDRCQWHRWEAWPRDAVPHHVALVADPQLVDPHTYPGRPWPLSALTISYTDLYLRRVYRLLQRSLYPDSTVFLGDLFDGGREWSTPHSKSSEERYQKYGDSFWHREYKRFSSIYFDEWIKAGTISSSNPTLRRQILPNLPGNHDLGFATGIQEPVRNRFNAYFGDGNSLNLLGNHSFVSIDTVSLSAKGQADAPEHLWKPTQDFLHDYPALLARRLSSYNAILQGQPPVQPYRHDVIQTADLESSALSPQSDALAFVLPTVLLSHVPLYRDPGTPCGPLRERWPLRKDSEGNWLAKDDRNALSITGGYQYWNVLSPEITFDIASRLVNISYAFSGDDHDYCELLHTRYPSSGQGIKEITVKSTSWAMGVRLPAFQLLSLWNPLHSTLHQQHASTPTSTLQTTMCLLPDQLGIFLVYVKLLLLTLMSLIVKAVYVTVNPSSSRFTGASGPVLPLSQPSTHRYADKALSSSSDDGLDGLSARSRLSVKHDLLRTRSISPKPSLGYGLPPRHPVSDSSSGVFHHPKISTSYSSNSMVTGVADFISAKPSNQSRLKGLHLFRLQLLYDVLQVALPAVVWYFWLLRNA